MTVLWQSSDCPVTALCLSSNFPPTVLWLPLSVLWLFSDFPPTVLRLSSDCPQTVLKLSSDCPSTVFLLTTYHETQNLTKNKPPCSHNELASQNSHSKWGNIISAGPPCDLKSRPFGLFLAFQLHMRSTAKRTFCPPRYLSTNDNLLWQSTLSTCHWLKYFRHAVVHYGNTGCRVFKRGIQNWKDFCLKINIPKGNY